MMKIIINPINGIYDLLISVIAISKEMMHTSGNIRVKNSFDFKFPFKNISTSQYNNLV